MNDKPEVEVLRLRLARRMLFDRVLITNLQVAGIDPVILVGAIRKAHKSVQTTEAGTDTPAPAFKPYDPDVDDGCPF